MDEKIIYIAHPISGDVEGNLKRISAIYLELCSLPNIIPFAPYVATLNALDDSIKEQREAGIKHNEEIFRRGVIDEVWLFGDRISNGMKSEKELAQSLGIPVIDKTK